MAYNFNKMHHEIRNKNIIYTRVLSSTTETAIADDPSDRKYSR